MRISVMVLAVVLATASVAGAQAPPASPAGATAADTAKLDVYLKRWEEESRKVQTLSAVLGRIDQDKSFGTTRKYSGLAQYMRSGTGPSALNLAHLEMKEENKPDFAEKVICTGTYLYVFVPPQKEIRAYEIKRKAGQAADDNFMSFMFGMKAEEAKKRYVLKLDHEDKYYIYVDVLPRFAADKAEFARARLVLNKDNFLPRRLWFEHVNGGEITWDIPRLQSGVSIDRRVFDAPKVPKEWKLVPVSVDTNTPPRVVRPKKD